MATNILDLVTLTLKFDLLKKTLTLPILSLPEEVGLSYITCTCFVARPFQDRKFDLVILTLKNDLLFKNVNLGHSFLTRRGGTFLFQMYIHCDKAFSRLPKV